jgi:hypothetical protein
VSALEALIVLRLISNTASRALIDICFLIAYLYIVTTVESIATMSALHASPLNIHSDSQLLLALKGFSIGTTLFVAGSMATTSLQFVPALILATQQKDSKRPQAGRQESGCLTPQPTPGQEKQINLSPAAALQGKIDESIISSRGYKLAAQQFSLISKTAFATQVPFELVTVFASGYLAFHYRSIGQGAWSKWAAIVGLVATVFPLSGGFMGPLDHKIGRLAGTEPAIEPYEDSPPDREAERSNAEMFLKKWNTLNAVRGTIMFAAGAVGLWDLLG